jgi:hypothetical protein
MLGYGPLGGTVRSPVRFLRKVRRRLRAQVDAPVHRTCVQESAGSWTIVARPKRSSGLRSPGVGCVTTCCSG